MNGSVVVIVARREAVELARDGRLRWAAGLVVALLIASLIASVHQTRMLRDLRERAQTEERDRWLNKGKMLAHPAMHFGFYVFQPYHSLAALDSGITPFAGAYTLLEAHEQSLFQDRPAADDVPTRWLSSLTPALCLQVVVPLLIIAMAFGTYVGERERGTWRQVLSTGVNPWDACVGKALGISAPLIALFVPAALAGGIALAWSSPVSSSDIGIRLSLLSAGYALYFGGVLGVSLAVSMIAQTSRQALVVLVTSWFVTTLMVPFAAADLGDRLFPSPTSFEYAADILKAKNAQHYPTAREVLAELLQQYRVSSRDHLPVSPEGIHLLKQQRIDNPIYDQALGRLYGTYRQQEHVMHLASFIAPALAMQSISMAVADDDVEAHVRFAEHASRYRHLMETILDEDQAYNLTPGPRDRRLWEKIPPFIYQPRSLFDVLRTCALPLAALGAWALAIAACLRWSASSMLA